MPKAPGMLLIARSDVEYRIETVVLKEFYDGFKAYVVSDLAAYLITIHQGDGGGFMRVRSGSNFDGAQIKFFLVRPRRPASIVSMEPRCSDARNYNNHCRQIRLVPIR